MELWKEQNFLDQIVARFEHCLGAKHRNEKEFQCTREANESESLLRSLLHLLPRLSFLRQHVLEGAGNARNNRKYKCEAA